MRILKILGWFFLALLVILGILFGLFIYKVKNGFPVSYETEVPAIEFPEGKLTVLVFSKATGFHHTESIETGKRVFDSLATLHNWFVYQTEAGGVFNPAQLARFDVVVFNNCTGRLLNPEQQTALEQFVMSGGKLIGIHGAGDDSHHWPWYMENLTGSDFSHHTMNPQFQEAKIQQNPEADSLMRTGLPDAWTHSDEWYTFYKNPATLGFTVLYAIDGTKILPSGNMLWISDKDFGMGATHPVAWYKTVGKGGTFYTSMGHDRQAWESAGFVPMLYKAITH